MRRAMAVAADSSSHSRTQARKEPGMEPSPFAASVRIAVDRREFEIIVAHQADAATVDLR